MAAGVVYSLRPVTIDHVDFVHQVGMSVLLAAPEGQVDLNHLARQELDRGTTKTVSGLYPRGQEIFTRQSRTDGGC